MEIWKELLGTYVGQLSLTVIIIVLSMGVFYARLFIKKMNEAEADQPKIENAHSHPSSTR